MMDSYINWRDEDNKYLDIDVLHPRTHIKDGRGLYTDYEIHVKTNHPEFAIKDYHVRRRYSEFVWLKNRLGMNDIMMTTAPSLPGKKVIGKFKGAFLKKRQIGLQNFMNKVVEMNAFLSDPALHLFLQTDLSIEQMENYLQHGMLLSNVRDRVIILQKNRERKQKDKETQETPPNNIAACNLKKTLSLDSIATLKNHVTVTKTESGRGWSEHKGWVGFCSWEVATDRDMTDFSPTGTGDFRLPKKMATARVLPGGQLQLPEDSKNVERVHTILPHRRTASWHGNTSDIIDFLLGSYDIIALPKTLHSSVDVDSMTYSQGSKLSNGETYESSNDYLEFDVDEHLCEYTVVTLYPTHTNNTTSTENGFHHSLSASYDLQG